MRRTLVCALVVAVALAASGCGSANTCEGTCGGGGGQGGEPGIVAGGAAIPDPSGAADYVLFFGDVATGERAVATFPLENVGATNRLIHVGEIASPFGLSGGPTMLPSGGTGALEFTYAPGIAARHEATVAIDDGDRSFSVRLTGRSEPGALDCPERISFDADVGVEATTTVTCTNVRAVPFGLRAAVDAPFAVTPEQAAVEPTKTVDLELAWTPDAAGSSTGTLRLEDTTGRELAVVEIAGTAYAGPRFSCDAGPFDFGFQAIGMQPERLTIHCTNTGDRAAASIATTSDDPAFVATGPAGAVDAGASFPVEVAFAPSAEGSRSGTVAIESTPPGGSAEVPVVGFGRQLAPCAMALSPTALRFPRVAPGQIVALDLELINDAPHACAVRGLQLVDGSGAFSMPEDVPANFDLDAGRRVRFPVTFSPTAEGEFAAAVEMRVSDPAQEQRSLPIAAVAGDTCLQFEPAVVDFGMVRQGCSASRSVAIQNTCTWPVRILGVDPLHASEPQSPGAGFSFDPAVVLPATLAAAGTRNFELGYANRIHGAENGGLVLDVGQEGELFLPMRGAGDPDFERTDNFTAGARKLDVLFVVDNTADAATVQQALVSHVQAFLSRAQADGVDWQLGITTAGFGTGGPGCSGTVNGAEGGRLFPVNRSSDRILTPRVTGYDALFDSYLQAGTCQSTARAFDAAVRALSPGVIDVLDVVATPEPLDGNLGFLRADAHLAVIFVMAADDESGTGIAATYNFLAGVKGVDHPELLSVHVLAPGTSCGGFDPAGTRLEGLVAVTDGAVVDACAADVPMAQQLGAAAASWPTAFLLEALPEDKNADGVIDDRGTSPDLVVLVDGEPVPSRNLAGDVVWDFNSALGSVRFRVPLAAGQQVEVRYAEDCR
ncbi:choice-of-anchor D domain-containing protein [Vulgatibacter sp.]|uniref:choice-of-anchor D domain-containing protein n=1 Tax=Vulgatibacter sp. TaxID=1971226 RepID=UPI003562CC27